MPVCDVFSLDAFYFVSATHKATYPQCLKSLWSKCETAVGKTKAQWHPTTTLSWKNKKVHKLVFKHLEQLVQRTEPAEPLITVIYKPDSTLMGRQNLPSPSSLHSPTLPLHILHWLLRAIYVFTHLPTLAPSVTPPLSCPLLLYSQLVSTSVVSCYHQSLLLFFPAETHSLALYCFKRKRRRER